MKNITTIITFITVLTLSFTKTKAQVSFANNPIIFEGVYGSLAVADVDGDTDYDFIIVGEDTSSLVTASLYLNNGTGSFTKSESPSFIGARDADVSFADIDGDKDQDLVITGGGSNDEIFTRMYTNDGLGVFSEVLPSPFTGVKNGSINFIDIDNDSDFDAFITGFDGSNNISKLYINNGAGMFTELVGTSFDGIGAGSAAFADVDGDLDQDVIIAGRTGSTVFDKIAKLYINEGANTFSEDTKNSFVGVSNTKLAFSDIAGDLDQDLLITGQEVQGGAISKLFVNDGSGDFTEVNDTPFPGVLNGAIHFSDLDGDLDADLLITGTDTSRNRIAKVFNNNGLGEFTEQANTPLVGVTTSDIIVADFDNNSNLDVLISGLDTTSNLSTILYKNANITTGILNELSFLNIKCFPNPSASSITLELAGKFAYLIFDTNGKLVEEGEAMNREIINLLSWKKGKYIVQFNTKDITSFSEFVVR